MDILNSLVKVQDVNLLRFLYPGFKVIYEPEMFISTGIIYLGADKYINYVKNAGVPYIIVRKNAEYDLDNRETLLKVVFGKYGKDIPKYLQDIYEDIPDDEFMESVKICWVTGKWLTKEVNNSTKYFDLLNSVVTDATKIYQLAAECINELGVSSLEYRVLKYLMKCVNGQFDMKSKYGREQQVFMNNRGVYVKKAAQEYLESSIDNTELRVINFIRDLSRN